MPILGNQDDLWPVDLLISSSEDTDENSRSWYCVYTLSRREKDLMRKLKALDIAYYGPVIPKRYRSPNGRLRTSYIPLFPNYVFLWANEKERHSAFTSNCISKCTKVTDPESFQRELQQIYRVINAGVPLTPESRLEAGDRIRVKSGPFMGYEGNVIRREGKTKLLLSIQFLEQGVSMEIDEGLLEVI